MFGVFVAMIRMTSGAVMVMMVVMRVVFGLSDREHAATNEREHKQNHEDEEKP
jgi:hypothetical protein